MRALLPDSSHRATALGGDFRGARPHVLQVSICCVSATPQGPSVSLAGKLTKPGVALEATPPPVHVPAVVHQLCRVRRVVLPEASARLVLVAGGRPGTRAATNELRVERRMAARTYERYQGMILVGAI